MLSLVENRVLGWDAALTPDERDAADAAFAALSNIRPTPSAKPVGIMTAAEARRALWLLHIAAQRRGATALAPALEETRAEATDPMTFAVAEFLLDEARKNAWRFEARGGFQAR